ncbi:hypothetical protein C8R42DRAFT_645688 [Lentinula raphanica]|nr:hypothetical protein C8R42DRAFT_645688 [Lentinula raphanica]
MPDSTQNTALEQRLATLTERASHKQYIIQADIIQEIKYLEELVETLAKSTRSPDCLGAYTQDLLGLLKSMHNAVEGSLNRLRTYQNDIMSIRKEITQIRLLSIVQKLQKESARDITEDMGMAEIINKVSLLVLSYVETADGDSD